MAPFLHKKHIDIFQSICQQLSRENGHMEQDVLELTRGNVCMSIFFLTLLCLLGIEIQ